MNVEAEIEDVVSYLKSERALAVIDADPYWPKWDSPWWQMSLLHEMDLTSRIPEVMIGKYIESLGRMPLKIFPIYPGEMPEGIDPYRETPCHCQLGNVYQVLSKWGVDVDRELPWIRPWFLKYQMPDGGFNCDNDAYLVRDESPSSMVGTIAAFEAMLLYTNRAWTVEEEAFLEKGAKFLMGRKLIHGSTTKYNASERASAEKWTKLCFPRFYFYDVLRGLDVLLKWSEKTGRTVPFESIREAVTALTEKSRESGLRNDRLSYEGAGTIALMASGQWERKQPARMFPLLNKVSATGETSPWLTNQWESVQKRLAKYPEFARLL